VFSYRSTNDTSPPTSSSRSPLDSFYRFLGGIKTGKRELFLVCGLNKSLWGIERVKECFYEREMREIGAVWLLILLLVLLLLLLLFCCCCCCVLLLLLLLFAAVVAAGFAAEKGKRGREFGRFG